MEPSFELNLKSPITFVTDVPHDQMREIIREKIEELLVISSNFRAIPHTLSINEAGYLHLEFRDFGPIEGVFNSFADDVERIMGELGEYTTEPFYVHLTYLEGGDRDSIFGYNKYFGGTAEDRDRLMNRVEIAEGLHRMRDLGLAPTKEEKSPEIVSFLVEDGSSHDRLFLDLEGLDLDPHVREQVLIAAKAIGTLLNGGEVAKLQPVSVQRAKDADSTDESARPRP